MAAHKLRDCAIFVDGFLISAVSNVVRLNQSAEAVDLTCLGNTTKVHGGGLLSWEASIEGFVEYGAAALEAMLAARLASVKPIGLVPAETGTIAVGDLAYFGSGLLKAAAAPSGAAGEYERFTLPIEGGAGPLVRGVVARVHGTAGGSATSAALNLGAVPAGSRLWAAAFCRSLTGSAVAVAIETDTASNFPSAVTALSLSSLTAAGEAVIGSVAGPITDTYQRAVVTVTGTEWDGLILVGISS